MKVITIFNNNNKNNKNQETFSCYLQYSNKIFSFNHATFYNNMMQTADV